MTRGAMEITYRTARRIAVLVAGVSVVGVGVAMIILPGPALVVIPAGLAILSIEFAWARRWLRRLRDEGRALARRLGNGDPPEVSGDVP